MVELQQIAQPFSALDLSFAAYFRCRLRDNDVVTDALVMPFLMIVHRVFLEYVAKRPLTEKNHLVQTFGFYR